MHCTQWIHTTFLNYSLWTTEHSLMVVESFVFHNEFIVFAGCMQDESIMHYRMNAWCMHHASWMHVFRNEFIVCTGWMNDEMNALYTMNTDNISQLAHKHCVSFLAHKHLFSLLHTNTCFLPCLSCMHNECTMNAHNIPQLAHKHCVSFLAHKHCVSFVAHKHCVFFRAFRVCTMNAHWMHTTLLNWHTNTAAYRMSISDLSGRQMKTLHTVYAHNIPQLAHKHCCIQERSTP